MSEDRVLTRERHVTTAMIRPWREELFDRVVRITAIVATPVIVVGLYYLISTQSYWMIPVALIAYGVVVVSTLVPSLRYVWRVWAFVSVLVALGISDLLAFGWGEDARIYLMSALLFTTIFLGGRHGLVALILSIGLLTTFVVVAGFELFVPLSYPIIQYSLSTLAVGLVIFVMLASALFTSFNYLFPRLFRALEESTQLSTTLESERATLAERTRALQEANLGLQRRAINLDASVQVSKTLATVFEMEPLLERAVDAIGQHFELFHAAIYLMDESGQWAVLRAASSMTGRQMVAQGHRQQRGGPGMIGRVAETRLPSIAEAGEAQTPDFPMTRSALIFPLVVDDTLIGVLDLKSTEEAVFDQDSTHTLEGVAGQLAMAVANARRFSEEAAVLETTSPTYRLVHRLATTRTEEDVYSAILRTVRSFNPARAFVIQTPSRVQRASDVAELWDDGVRVLKVADLDLDNFDALLAASAELTAPLLIADLTVPEAIPQLFQDLCRRLAEQLDLRSVALVPVHVEATLLGVLMVFYDTAHQFSMLEVQLYRIIEELGGVALERMGLINEAQSRVESERWLREFSEHIMRTPDLGTMMVEAAQSLRTAIQADGVAVSVALSDIESASPVGDEDV